MEVELYGKKIFYVKFIRRMEDCNSKKFVLNLVNCEYLCLELVKFETDIPVIHD